MLWVGRRPEGIWARHTDPGADALHGDGFGKAAVLNTDADVGGEGIKFMETAEDEEQLGPLTLPCTETGSSPQVLL